MQRLEVSGAVRPLYGSLGVKGLTSALNTGGWPTPRRGSFTPGKDPVPILWEAGWAPGAVRTGAENLVSTGIRLDLKTLQVSQE